MSSRSSRKVRFPLGCRVRDRETGEEGEVVYHYSEPNLRSEIVAVQFDFVGGGALAVPIDTLERVTASKAAAPRSGRWRRRRRPARSA
jgi:hypothetical protein